MQFEEAPLALDLTKAFTPGTRLLSNFFQPGGIVNENPNSLFSNVCNADVSLYAEIEEKQQTNKKTKEIMILLKSIILRLNR